MTKEGNGLDSVADQSGLTSSSFAVRNLNGCSSDLVQTKICSLFPRLQLTPDFSVNPGRDKR